MELKRLVLSVVVLAGVVACGGGEMIDDGQDGLSTVTMSYVLLRADQRKCAAPMCGGFFVREANKAGGAETYVARLDLSNAHLDDATAAKVTDAPAAELLLYGKLGRLDSKTKTRSYLVYAAYRGMPGVTPVAGDTLFTTTAKQVSCVAAPCLNQVALPVNGAAETSKSFSSYSVEGAARAFVDQKWLAAQVTSRGAIVSGSIVQGQQMAAGADQVLVASQIYIKLPTMIGPCMKMPINVQCAEDEVLTYVRDENRCLMADKCVKAAPCSMMLPACGDGYTLEQWHSASANGCNVAACDPTFSL